MPDRDKPRLGEELMVGNGDTPPDPDRDKLRESHKQMRSKRPTDNGHREPPTSFDVLITLADAGFQRGIEWRQRKQDAIREAVNQGKTIPWIIWYLRKTTGLTETTAKRLVNDAFLKEPDEVTKPE